MGYTYWWLILVVLWLCVFLPGMRRKRFNTIRRIRKKRMKKENSFMEELAKQFIGKECIIYVPDNSATVVGTVKEVSPGAVLVEDNSGGKQALNLDYITRIREYPRNKKGKKVSEIFVD